MKDVTLARENTKHFNALTQKAETAIHMNKEIKIACPKCNWEPDGGPHWSCSCGYTWNTFDTAGKCPSCGKQWKYTQCIPHLGGCPEWSLHEDWYRGLDEWVEEEIKEIADVMII